MYWTPQVIGGSGFVIASYVLCLNSSRLTDLSMLFMLENQKKWWRPAPLSLGWHVGCMCALASYISLILYPQFGISSGPSGSRSAASLATRGSSRPTGAATGPHIRARARLFGEVGLS